MEEEVKNVNRVSIRVPGHPRYAATVRCMTESIGQLLQLSEVEINRMKLCIDEAVCNVIRHGYGGPSEQPVEIAYLMGADSITVEIRDFARKVDPGECKPRCLDDVKPHGLGMHIIGTCSDHWEWDQSVCDGNLLRITKVLDRVTPCS